MLFLDELRASVSAFFSWWGTELQRFIPKRLSTLFYAPKAQLFIRLNNFEASFSHINAQQETELLRCYLHHAGKQQQADFFATQPQWAQANKILLLNSKQLLKKRLELPLATQDNLTQVLTYELDRYTPFTAEQCYFAFRVLGKNKAGNRLIVELLFIAKAKLQALYQELVTLNLPIDVIAHEEDKALYISARTEPVYNLLPRTLQPNTATIVKPLRYALLTCFLLLSATAIALPFWLQQQVLTDLQQQVKQAKQQAITIEALKTESNNLLSLEQQIIAYKTAAPVILNVIEQLSKLLPQDTWLKSFEYAEQKFALRGTSASSSVLIGLLEASPYFKQTTLTAPITRDKEGKGDRFQLETYRERNDVHS